MIEFLEVFPKGRSYSLAFVFQNVRGAALVARILAYLLASEVLDNLVFDNNFY